MIQRRENDRSKDRTVFQHFRCWWKFDRSAVWNEQATTIPSDVATDVNVRLFRRETSLRTSMTIESFSRIETIDRTQRVSMWVNWLRVFSWKPCYLYNLPIYIHSLEPLTHVDSSFCSKIVILSQFWVYLSKAKWAKQTINLLRLDNFLSSDVVPTSSKEKENDDTVWSLVTVRNRLSFEPPPMFEWSFEWKYREVEHLSRLRKIFRVSAFRVGTVSREGVGWPIQYWIYENTDNEPHKNGLWIVSRKGKIQYLVIYAPSPFK